MGALCTSPFFRWNGSTSARGTRGTAAIEFALCLPLLLLLLLGALEYGRALYTHQVMVKAIRDATRYLARTPGLTVGAVDTTTNPFGLNAKNLALRGSLSSTAPPLIVNPNGSNTPVAQVTFTVANTTSGTTFSGPRLIVTGILTYPFTSPLMTVLGLDGAFTIGLGHSERGIGGGA